MAAPSTVTALLALFKRLYKDNDLSNMALRRTPAFKKIKQLDDLDGEGLYVPINYAMPVGASWGGLAVAQANVTSSSVDRFFLQRKRIDGVVQITGEAIHASRKDVGAFLRVKQKEADEAIAFIGMQIGAAFWGDGAGEIGRTSTDPGAGATGTIQLINIPDAVNFHLKMVLNASATRTGGTIRTDKYTVTGVNRVTGVIDLAIHSGAAADWAANDYIYVDGNYDQVMHGVQSYIPASDPGVSGVPAALLGMTRTDDPVMKAGWRIPYQNSITETAEYAAATMGQYHTSASSALWLSDYNWFRLMKEQESMGKVVRDQRAEAVFGTPALTLLTPRGSVPVMADPFAPSDAGFMLDHTTWAIHHLLGLPHMVTDDSLSSLRMATEDALEIRFRGWVEVGCDRPFNNARLALA